MRKQKYNVFDDIYLRATDITYRYNQTVGEKNDYYITMAQLENILKILKSKDEPMKRSVGRPRKVN